MTIDALALAQDLIRCPSITPQDAGALDTLETPLKSAGFATWRLPFAEAGYPDIDNLFARVGTGGPHFCYAGHTDVVPVGDRQAWSFDPFAGIVEDGLLKGRGACDMKGSVAAFAAAAAGFVDRHGRDFGGSISLLITGDEEAEAVNGTRKVLAWMAENGHTPDAALVGEPSCPERLGEMMKIGRRGSVTAELTVEGLQGHVAYPDRTDNAANRMVRVLQRLIAQPLDAGTAHFVASNLEVVSVDVGNTAFNVVPARAVAKIACRYNDLHTGDAIIARIRAAAEAENARYTLKAHKSGDCFLTEPGPLSDMVQAAVKDVTGMQPELSTTGGTSDARFIKDYCPVVEFGLVNKTIHKVDEHVAAADVTRLAEIYLGVLERFFDRRA